MVSNQNQPVCGTFYGIGIGPGDPELITIKAIKTLNRIPVIFVPVTDPDTESLAGMITEKAVPGISAKFVPLHMPMHHDRVRLRESWQRAAVLIWETLKQNKDCAFINVGDPLIYGTFIYVLEALREVSPEVDVEIIPGISSVNAASARTITGLATGNESVAILSGHTDENKARNVLREFETIIFLKAGSSLKKLYPILEECDLLDNCVYIRRCTLPEEEIITDIRGLQKQEADYFSIMIVRK